MPNELSLNVLSVPMFLEVFTAHILVFKVLQTACPQLRSHVRVAHLVVCFDLQVKRPSTLCMLQECFGCSHLIFHTQAVMLIDAI
jgi:hypothetical protein